MALLLVRSQSVRSVAPRREDDFSLDVVVEVVSVGKFSFGTAESRSLVKRELLAKLAK